MTNHIQGRSHVITTHLIRYRPALACSSALLIIMQMDMLHFAIYMLCNTWFRYSELGRQETRRKMSIFINAVWIGSSKFYLTFCFFVRYISLRNSQSPPVKSTALAEYVIIVQHTGVHRVFIDPYTKTCLEHLRYKLHFTSTPTFSLRNTIKIRH